MTCRAEDAELKPRDRRKKKQHLEAVSREQLEAFRDEGYRRNWHIFIPMGNELHVGILCDMALRYLDASAKDQP